MNVWNTVSVWLNSRNVDHSEGVVKNVSVDNFSNLNALRVNLQKQINAILN